MSDFSSHLASALEGRYRIDAVIGEGGMASVYRARDLKHDRYVALKVLRPELAAAVGSERFLAEVRTTANLQHPHILPLFDSGEASGALFYVMPLVDGESLAERLKREKQLPVDEVVRIAAAVASALDYAHRHGIVHRDIKPANILLHEGEPLIADFGIALAVKLAGADRLTATGLAVGTPCYMSPEQVAGDSRIGPVTDVYALGCVVHEMLAGEPPYTGATVESILAKSLSGNREPVTTWRKSVPAHIDHAIGRALEPVPADRFQSAQEFASALQQLDRYVREITAPRNRTRTTALVGLLTVAALVAGWAISSSQRAGNDAHPRRFVMEVPPGQRITGLAVSRDQRAVYYAAGGLFRRALDTLHPVPIPETEGARDLALSPDGNWVAFVRGPESARRDTVYKVPLSGGRPVRVAVHDHIRGVAWASSTELILGSHEGGLWSVSAAGGELQPFTSSERASPHRYPHILPNGRGTLFHIFGSGAADEIAVLPGGSTEWRVIGSGRDPVYIPSGHLLFFNEGALWAVRFDVQRLEMRGDPVSVVSMVGWRGRTLFDWAPDGSAYYVEDAPEAPNDLVWVDENGSEKALEIASTHAPRSPTPMLSPDGRRLLKLENGPRLWLHDLQRGISERLTDDSNAEWLGVWRPDGSEIVFTSRRSGPFDMYRASLHGPKRIEAVGSGGGRPQDWTPDGRLLYTTDALRAWSLDSGTSTLLIDEPVRRARMSPNGRFIAYQMNTDGSDHVYLRPFPDVLANRWRVVGNDASQPEWSPDGTKLYFIQNKAIMASEITPDSEVPLGRARLLFEGPYLDFDVAPDGRLLAVREVSAPASRPADKIVVTQNWRTELKRLSKSP